MGLERIELPSSALEADILPVYYRPCKSSRKSLFFNLSNEIINVILSSLSLQSPLER